MKYSRFFTVLFMDATLPECNTQRKWKSCSQLAENATKLWMGLKTMRPLKKKKKRSYEVINTDIFFLFVTFPTHLIKNQAVTDSMLISFL